MVSYYNHPSMMYRHPQPISGAGQFPGPASWYPGYPQSAAVAGPPQPPPPPQSNPASYCMQDEQIWHHHHHHHPTATGPSAPGLSIPPPPPPSSAAVASHHHGFHGEFSDFVSHATAAASIHHHHHLTGSGGGGGGIGVLGDGLGSGEQLPSPPITVSGSEMSSPGGQSDHLGGGGGGGNTGHQGAPVVRPPPARSPYEWIKKPSYQTQPNPAINAQTLPLEFLDGPDPAIIIGKTRTKDKYRVVYTDHQRVELEKEFYYSRYITIRRKAELANNLGLSERQVKIWFQNRRAKERKQVKKREEFNSKESVINNNMVHISPTTQHHLLHNNSQTQLGQGMITTQLM